MGSIGMFIDYGQGRECHSFDLEDFTQLSMADKDCCEKGMLLPDVPTSVGLLFVQLLFLCYTFLGVALGADVFMQSIEVITSREKTKALVNSQGESKLVHYRVWNATVANLTLMALGSSAPEILLSVIEVIASGMATGPLGPSTIVGSAAFNLMIITAVCIIALPDGETRTLKQLGVFLTTAAYSVFAYIWLMVIVLFWTPSVITVVEGVLTMVFFVLLIVNAYLVDKYWDIKVSKLQRAHAVSSKDAALVVKKAGLSKDATPEELAAALRDEIQPQKTKAYYRRKLMEEKLSTRITTRKNKVVPHDGTDVEMGAPGGVSSTAMNDKAVIEKTQPLVATMAADEPGTVSFLNYEEKIVESGGKICISVVRRGGSKGELKVKYCTKDQESCKAGKDYEKAEGELIWADGDSESKTIEVTIIDDDEFEKDEHFTVVLLSDDPNFKFDHSTDGGASADVCTVWILNDDERGAKLSSALRLLRFDSDVLEAAGDDYMEAVRECFSWPEGGKKAKIMHVLTLPWQIMFKVLVPPAGLCNGWPCFVLALVWIGFQVVLISDFATQMGCQMYLPSTVTAITFVALGTSLPDTFASMQAARGDKTADSSIGNVTGSNSVNVFLGLGLPWLIGAAYWRITGPDTAWHEKYGPFSYAPTSYVKGAGMKPPTGMAWSDYAKYASSGAFYVSKTGLGFSVLVFTFLAILTIAVLLFRRTLKPPAELGGNKGTARMHAVLLLGFWLLYILLSCISDPQWRVITVNI